MQQRLTMNRPHGYEAESDCHATSDAVDVLNSPVGSPEFTLVTNFIQSAAWLDP